MTGDNSYEYSIDECDVVAENRTALIAFREKRRQWLAWLKTDEHHAISPLISSMAWNDVVFRTLWKITEIDPGSGLYNPLLAEALIEGHFAIQVLAIRRLMDKGHGVISLWRLLEDIKKNIRLFTRENFVAYDGLPYDYEAAGHRVMMAHLGRGPFWAARSGPDAHWPSKRAHEVFDRLTCVGPASRSRTDRIPKAVIDTLFGWLTSSEADQLVEWSHTFLAHAADRASRQRIDLVAARPSLDKISNVLRCFVRVAEAVQGYVLSDSGHGMIVPTAQFNQFDRLASPLLSSGGREELHDLWERLAKERNGFLEGTFEPLVA
jgi:AcrR family transcriptional regulator